MAEKQTVIKNRFLAWLLTWFKVYLAFFATVVVVYLWLHYFVPGAKVTYLTREELADIQILLSDSAVNKNDTCPSPRSCKRDRVKTFLLSRYDFTKRDTNNYNLIREFFNSWKREVDTQANHGSLDLLLDQFTQARYDLRFLANYPMKVKSYFWLTESNLYWEIIFWTWLGIFANLFFNVSEVLSKNEFRSGEKYIHLAKFIYGPPCSLIIFFALDSLVLVGDVTLTNLKYGVIVLSFLLGFYTRKSLELIDKIKNFVFGAKAKEGELKDGFEPDVTPEIVQEAIAANEEKWKQKYPFILSIRPGQKVETATNRKIAVINIEVSEKDASQVSTLPEYFNFITADNKIARIQRDVQIIKGETGAPAGTDQTETLG